MFPKYNFPLQEYTVIDGDTISVVLDMGWDVSINQSCRLLGIDAPEKSTAAGKALTTPRPKDTGILRRFRTIFFHILDSAKALGQVA
jgi:hypothetical protein